MSFALPQALWLFPLAPATAVLFLLAFRWRQRVIQRLAGGSGFAPAVEGTRARQTLKAVALTVALGAVLLGAARPYLGSAPSPVRPIQADLLVVLDVSLSMAAQDVSPSRLGLAKQETLNLIDRLQGDRLGLVAFGGAATLRFPLTYDYDAARLLVKGIEVDSAPTPGTALAEGVRTALRGLRQSEAPLRAILLVSDGEDHGSRVAQAAEEAAAAGIPIHTLGVGTPQGGAIPAPGPGAAGASPKRDRAGQVVITRLEEGPLRQLAEATQGTHRQASGSARELQRLYDSISLRGGPLEQELPATPANDLTPYLALLAFLLLLVDLVLPEHDTPRAALRPALGFSLLGLLALAACSPEGPLAYDLNQQGGQLYRQSRFGEALESFRQAQLQRPDLPELNFNAGDALYQLAEYDRALRETQRALAAGDAELRGQAHFNMGNGHYQMERFQDAYEEYKKALREDPGDFDAKVNLELALRRLQQQERQQPNQGNQPSGGQEQQRPPGQRSGDQQEGQSGGQGQPRSPQADPAEELRRSLREAGAEISIEEALRILDVLRERERQLQTQYNQQQPGTPRASSRPDKDW